MCGQESPADDGNAHRAEVFWSADANVGAVTPVISRNFETARTVSAGEWQAAHGPGQLHTRQLLETLRDLAIEVILLRRSGGGRQPDAEYQQVSGIKSGIDAQHAHEALYREPGADEQNKGKTDFSRDQDRTAAIIRGGAAAFAFA